MQIRPIDVAGNFTHTSDRPGATGRVRWAIAVDVHWESINEAWDADNVEFPVVFCPTGQPVAWPRTDA